MGMFYGSLNYTTSGRKRRRLSVKKNSPKTFVTSTANKPKTYADVRRETDIKYPSRDDSTGSTPRQEPQQYTGTLVRGIATALASDYTKIEIVSFLCVDKER